VTPGDAPPPAVGGVAAPPPRHDALRLALLVAGVVLFLIWLLPPLTGWARRYEFVEALQFAAWAVVVPVLLVAGAPWRRLRLAGAVAPRDEELMVAPAGGLRPVDALALGRRRHPEALRSACFVALFIGGAVLWRTPAAVDGLSRHLWLAPVEAVTLTLVGVGLWCELVESPPLTPRLSRPYRIGLAAVSMWSIWILAYLVGLSHGSWYPAYPHHPGQGLSLSADQQLATGLLWFVSGCAFIPVVFWNLIRWLQSEENPDGELYRLVRQERIRGRSIDPGSSPS
jgi:cytochrome c oxidase assembly factor CtaG